MKLSEAIQILHRGLREPSVPLDDDARSAVKNLLVRCNSLAYSLETTWPSRPDPDEPIGAFEIIHSDDPRPDPPVSRMIEMTCSALVRRDLTLGPWIAKPRHIDNDGFQDQIDGLGWDLEGPPVPMLRGQFARAADAYAAAASPDMVDVLISVSRLGSGGKITHELYQKVTAALERAYGGKPVQPLGDAEGVE